MKRSKQATDDRLIDDSLSRMEARLDRIEAKRAERSATRPSCPDRDEH